MLKCSKVFIARYFFQLTLSVVFLLSSWLKLYPIEPFELTLVDSGVVTWSLAPYLARFFLSFEFFLGLALLFNTRFTLIALKSALYLTLFFTIYLLLLWYFRGSDVNCGCFGSKLSLTPIESLLKNAILIIINLTVIKLYKSNNYSFKWIYVLGGIILIVLPYILNPLDGYFSRPDNIEYPYRFQYKTIPDSVLKTVPFDLDSGTYLIPFLSVDCPHCKIAAQKLWVAQNQYNLPEIHAFFVGDEQKMNEFRFESSSALPYSMYRSNSFFKFTNGVLPTVFLIKDGMVIKSWSGSLFSYDEIQKIPEMVSGK